MQFVRLRRHGARLKRLMQRPARDQLLVVQAFVLLGASRLVIRTRGLAGLNARFGIRMAESPQDIAEADTELAERISWAIRSVRIYTPWDSNCFAQAATAHRLLQRAGTDSTVYFGATRHGDGLDQATNEGFAAHCWVRCGDRFVTGGTERHAYTPIVWFGPNS